LFTYLLKEVIGGVGFFALQEGELMTTYETTYGTDYNTQMFLQEQACPVATHARNEPLQVCKHHHQFIVIFIY